MLNRYAERKGGALTALSGDWVWRLDIGARRVVIFGYDFGLNSTTTEKLCRDKAAMAALLARDEVPTPTSRLLLHPGFAHMRSPDAVRGDLRAAFTEFGGDVVIKPNEGTGGRRLARARSVAAAEDAAAAILALEQNALIQPFIPALRELRVYLLDQRVELTVEKDRETRPDGGWTGNMGLGAIGRLAAVDTELAALAARAAAALDLRFGSLDILIDETGPLILEANNGVMLENFSRLGEQEANLAEALYGRALDLRFAETGN